MCTCFWQFTIGLQVPGLVRVVPEDDIGFGILVIPEPDQDDVSLVDPHLRERDSGITAMLRGRGILRPQQRFLPKLYSSWMLIRPHLVSHPP